MAGRSLFPRVAELEAARGTFAVATVVAVQRPTSARPGAMGIIHPDGTIEGWVGGSCAQPVVVREALRSLVDGHPRLLRLSKTAPAEGRRGDGVVELVMTCHSGGTLEIYVEPHLPAPSLWLAGTTPIVGALATLGAATGWRVSVFDPIADAEAFPDAERVSTVTALGRVDPELSPVRRRRDAGDLGRGGARGRAAAGRVVRGARGLADPGRRRAVVAARRGERARGTAGGAARAGRHGPRRRDARGDRALDPRRAGPGPPGTRARSSPRPDRRRWRAPARPRALEAASLAPVVDDIVLLDPVCGMTVDREHARHLAEHDGVVYAFCSMGCRTAFIKEPGAFVPGSTTAEA